MRFPPAARSALLTRCRPSDVPYLRPALLWVAAVGLADAVSQVVGYWSRYSRPGVVAACVGAVAALAALILLLPRREGRVGLVTGVFAAGLLGVEVVMLVTTADTAPFGVVNWAPGTLGMTSLLLLAYQPVLGVVLLAGAHAVVILGAGLLQEGVTATGLASAGVLVVAASLSPAGGSTFFATHVHELRVRAATHDLLAATRWEGRTLEHERMAHRTRLESLRTDALQLFDAVARGEPDGTVNASVARRAAELSAELREELVSQRRRSWLTELAEGLAPRSLVVADPEDRLSTLPPSDRGALFRLVALVADLLVDPSGSVTVAVQRTVVIVAEPVRHAAATARSATVRSAVADVVGDVTIEQWDLRDGTLLVELALPAERAP